MSEEQHQRDQLDMAEEDPVTVTPHECSVKGGERIYLSFLEALPEMDVFLLFHGSQEEHKVLTQRNGTATLYATIPAHNPAEVVDLSVCYTDESGTQRTLFKTQFAYTVDEKQYMAELLVQSVGERGVPLQYSLFPPLPTTEALREFDRSLTEALQVTELPGGWSLVGLSEETEGRVEDCSPRETLLHFAARHSLNSLARHLLSLPGAGLAALLPNEKGEMPLDLARRNSNEGLAQLLTLFVNQSPARHPELMEEQEVGPMEGVGQGVEPTGGTHTGRRKKSCPELQRFKEINNKWKIQVKRYKTSSESLGHVCPSEQTGNRAPSPQLGSPSPVFRKPCKRRRSIAVMDSSHRHLLLHTAPMMGENGSVRDLELAEMDRLRKTSWSRVVGNCESRSVGTGLNELERITAEDSLQQKVVEMQTDLTEPDVQNETTMTHLSLTHAQLNLLYGLSASCPLLNEDNESASPSFILSAATSPGRSSPLSDEDDGRRSSDIVESISPHLLHPISSGLSEEGEINFWRTDSHGSTGSHLQQKHIPVPQVITTEYTESHVSSQNTPKESLDIQRRKKHKESGKQTSAFAVVVNPNGNANNSLSASTVVLEEEEEGDCKGEGMGMVSASISAPNLFLIAQGGANSSSVELEMVKEDGLQPEEEPAELPLQEEVRLTTESKKQNHSTPVTGPRQRDNEAERSDTTQTDSTESAVMSPTGRLSTPVKYRSHRRSMSTSEMEMFSPSREMQKIHRTEELEENESASWQVSLGSTSVGDITANSTQSLSVEQRGRVGSKGGELDDRSRASSFVTNETGSLHESEGFSDEGDFLSAQESLHSLSRSSLEPYSQQASHDSTKSQESAGKKATSNELKPQEENFLGVVRRNGSKRRSLKDVPAINRYSADFQITNIDEYIDNSSDGELNQLGTSTLPGRRYKSTSSTLHLQGKGSVDQLDEEEQNGQYKQEHKLSDSSVSSASNPEQYQLTVSPKKRSVDSVFEQDHDVALSDVDVKLAASDESGTNSLIQSLESSLDNSFFFKDSGSPKVIKRRGKSPLLSRKSKKDLVDGSPGSRSPVRKPGGVSKEEVGRAVRTLRNLIDIGPEVLSDESDVTIGPETRNQRAGSLHDYEKSKKLSAVTVQRSSSAVSDSLVYYKEREPQTAPPDCVPTDCTSLDFASSPHFSRKFADIKHPPSPLFFARTKTPPTPSDSSLQRNTPSPIHPVSATRFVTPKSPISKQRSNPVGVEPVPKKQLRQAMSFDDLALRESEELATREGITSEPRGPLEEVPEVESSLDKGVRGGKEAANQEELLAETAQRPSVEIGPPELASHSGGLKNLFRGGFLRSSKQTKKKGLVRGTINDPELSESFSVPGHLRGSKVRSKSGKGRAKLDETTFREPEGDDLTFVLPEDYSPELRKPRSGSVQLESYKSATVLGIGRRDSDSYLHSPASQRIESQTLSPLEEVPSSESPPPLTSPPLQEPQAASDSELEESAPMDEQLVRSLSTSYPELAVQEELTWDKTIDRKIVKKMQKGERERQAIIHELLQTEKHHLRALKVLKLIFRENMLKVIPEEALNPMFPELDNLVEISEHFIENLESRKQNGSVMVEDISDVLLEQFMGDSRDRMLHAFGGFCSGHLTAMDIYKDHLRKSKHLNRLMNELHRLKECHRLTLPDYYTQVSQRLAKLVTLLQRLMKKTESLKLDHASRLRQSWMSLQELVTAVDQAVEDSKNRMELIDIQSRLEISVPRSAKNCNRQEIKSLNLTAQDRKLRKRGEAMWKGHGKQLSVHVVLVTDLLVLLTERDQKYHLAALQDLKPPVIRLYDLHVRLNASVKSGVQLLLLEQGEFPEMFRLEFSDKKEVKVWEAALNSAVEECKEKELKCEFFGFERVVSGDEERRSEEKEGESDLEGEQRRQRKKGSRPATPDISSPSLRRLQRARESLDLASRLLSLSSLPPTPTTTDANTVQRHTAATSGVSRTFRESPRNRQRAQTGFQRPKTAYFDEVDVHGEPHGGGKVAKTKRKKKVERSTTFRNKDKDKDKEKDKDKDKDKEKGGTEGAKGARIPEQQYVECITNLKQSLEEIMDDSREKTEELMEKDKELSKLRKELEALKDLHSQENARAEAESPVSLRISPRGSPQMRPHSYHIELNEERPEEKESETSPPGVGSSSGSQQKENETSDTGT